MEFVPIALACGHVVTDWAWFEAPAVGSAEPARVECPEGCGFVEFVVEPHEGQQTCLCQPGRHVCGKENTTVVSDLGYRDQGDEIEVDFE
jgi:hypothetical protein